MRARSALGVLRVPRFKHSCAMACREPERYAQPPLRSLHSPCPCGRGEPDRPDALTQPMEANGDAFGGRSTEFADPRQTLRSCFQTTTVSRFKLGCENGRAIPKVPRASARRGPMSEHALSEHEHGSPSQNTPRSSASDLARRLSGSDLTLAKPPDHRNINSPKNWCGQAALPVGLCAAVRGGVPGADDEGIARGATARDRPGTCSDCVAIGACPR